MHNDSNVYIIEDQGVRKLYDDLSWSPLSFILWSVFTATVRLAQGCVDTSAKK